MNLSLTRSLCAALISLGVMIGAQPAGAKTDTTPDTPQPQAAATEAVRPLVDKESADQMEDRRQKTITEANAAVAETQKALLALDQDKPDDALAALEIATGKLELILSRNPTLALAPISVEMLTVDLLATPETVKSAIKEAEDYLKQGDIQSARPLVANLASEIVFRTTSVPLGTYPEAIKAVAPLIDTGKIEEAKAELQAVLNTLVVTTDDVIPLPKLRAESLLGQAESLVNREDRTAADNERLSELMKEARNQLIMAELLGYGTKKSYKPIYEQLDQIEAKAEGGKSGKGWFDKIKAQLKALF
jgi:hypothetical protein